jgi:outer membrane protein, heavy metal efflux system
VQGAHIKNLLAAASCLLLLSQAAAGEYTSVQIGHTGQRLHNSAPSQPKHYVMHEGDLLARIDCLMDDVDRLLVRLHCLPPETAGTDPVVAPADTELGWLFKIALRHNPELARPRSELAVLAAQTRQAGAPQDPLLSFELMDIEAPFGPIQGVDETGFGVGFSRMFESYGKRGLRREIASREEELLELELAQMEVDLMFEVTEEYYDLFGLVVRMRSLEDNIELMKVLLEIANQRLAVGTTTQAEVLNAQVQLSRMELMRIELSAMIDQSYITLAGMLGNCSGLNLKDQLKFDAPYPLPPQIQWDNQTFLAEALARYPDYQRIRFMDERQDLEVEMAKREYYPDYELMARYEAGIGRGDMYSLEVEIPLFLNKEERQDARLQEMYAEKAVIKDEGDVVLNEYTTRIKNLQVEMRMHGELVDLLRLGTVPQARLALESSIAAYAAGETPSSGASSMSGGSAGMASTMGGPPAIGAGENAEEAEAGGVLDGGMGSSSAMGPAMPATGFNTVLLAQQALLTQEQELEQNYIHILHVLADLQVLTLGAFDPKPYMVTALEPVKAATEPVVVEPAAPAPEDAVVVTPRTEAPIIGGETPSDSGLPQAEISESEAGHHFIDSLNLPIRAVESENEDRPARDSSGEVVEIPVVPRKSEASPEGHQAVEDEEATDPTGKPAPAPTEEFYKPFEPEEDSDG